MHRRLVLRMKIVPCNKKKKPLSSKKTPTAMKKKKKRKRRKSRTYLFFFFFSRSIGSLSYLGLRRTYRRTHSHFLPQFFSSPPKNVYIIKYHRIYHHSLKNQITTKRTYIFFEFTFFFFLWMKKYSTSSPPLRKKKSVTVTTVKSKEICVIDVFL